jgi:hypothetical protein
MAYIYPAPGSATAEVVLTLIASANTTSNLSVPSLQDITVNNSNDVFTWTQLDDGDKLQIATTATNSLDMNLVLDQTAFFGNVSANAVSAAGKGIFNLSADKTRVGFSLFLGNTSTGGAGKTLSGNAYITGLAPTVSADAPVWVSPITLTVDGGYIVT